MHHSRKKFFEELPEELTEVWSCSSETCKGWMRANFAFSAVPVCSQCQSEMVKETRMLAIIANSSPVHSKP